MIQISDSPRAEGAEEAEKAEGAELHQIYFIRRKIELKLDSCSLSSWLNPVFTSLMEEVMVWRVWSWRTAAPCRSPSRGAVVLSSSRGWDKVPKSWILATFLLSSHFLQRKEGKCEGGGQTQALFGLDVRREDDDVTHLERAFLSTFIKPLQERFQKSCSAEQDVWKGSAGSGPDPPSVRTGSRPVHRLLCNTKLSSWIWFHRFMVKEALWGPSASNDWKQVFDRYCTVILHYTY